MSLKTSRVIYNDDNYGIQLGYQKILTEEGKLKEIAFYKNGASFTYVDTPDCMICADAGMSNTTYICDGCRKDLKQLLGK